MAATSDSINEIDVSHYQEVVDWSAVAESGDRFGIAKASEGRGWSDQYFVDNWVGMKNAGLARGAYHFYHPNADPEAQIDNFLKCLNNANGGVLNLGPYDLPVALDIEVTDGAAVGDILAGAKKWLNVIEAATHKRPIVYTYVSFWQNALGNPPDLSDYPLWIAHLDVPSPTVPGNWRDWVFWQFSKQPRTGVPSNTTDLDRFNGTPAGLQNWLSS